MVGEAIGAGWVCASTAWRNGDADGLGAVDDFVAVFVCDGHYRCGCESGVVDCGVSGWIHR